MSKQSLFFDFRQCVLLLKSTGRRAGDLKELREALSTVSQQSIYHHTCEYFLKDIPVEYTNDFAHWAGQCLEERSLAEQLSTIDPFSLNSVQDVRRELLLMVDNYLEESPRPRQAWPGDEFHFNQAVCLIFPAGIRVRNLAEFLMAVKSIDSASIYYHFYEARMRLGSGQDDFSQWINDVLGNSSLAQKIRDIDPFMNQLEDIREYLIDAVERELRIDMEIADND